MSKDLIDYSELERKVYKKSYKLSEVKDRIEKVAFDVVRFKDNDVGADLWQVQSADDGEQYIVALYTPSQEDVKTAGWEVSLSKTAGMLHISYNGDPIVKVASGQLGITGDELSKVPSYLPFRLAKNKKLVTALLKELNETAREEVLKKYPELG